MIMTIFVFNLQLFTLVDHADLADHDNHDKHDDPDDHDDHDSPDDPNNLDNPNDSTDTTNLEELENLTMLTSKTIWIFQTFQEPSTYKKRKTIEDIILPWCSVPATTQMCPKFFSFFLKQRNVQLSCCAFFHRAEESQ